MGETETQFITSQNPQSAQKQAFFLGALQVRHEEIVLWRGLKSIFLGQGIPGTIEGISHYPKQGLLWVYATSMLRAGTCAPEHWPPNSSPPPNTQAGAWKGKWSGCTKQKEVGESVDWSWEVWPLFSVKWIATECFSREWYKGRKKRCGHSTCI